MIVTPADNLQSAINYAWDNGKPIDLVAGEYAVGNITLPTANAALNYRTITIRGAGAAYVAAATPSPAYGTRLKFMKTDGTDCISCLSTGAFTHQTVTISDLSLLGPDTQGSVAAGRALAIDGTACTHLFLERIFIAGFYGIGKPAIALGNCQNGSLRDVEVVNCDTGLCVGLNSNANTFVNVTANFCKTRGIVVQNCTNNLFIGGMVQSTLKTGLEVRNAQQIQFLNMHFENNNATQTAGERSVYIVAGASENTQNIALQNCTFNTSYGPIELTGVDAGHKVKSIRIVDGRANGLPSPKVVIGAFAEQVTIDEFCAPSDVQGPINIIWHG